MVPNGFQAIIFLFERRFSQEVVNMHITLNIPKKVEYRDVSIGKEALNIIVD
jgi:transposase-like protein